jgi:NAD(P)H-flavin reductase/ferredoxin/truncated hemoglobin YjbI
MNKIIFQGKSYPCSENETVLDVLLRANVNVSFSCRNGICHSCVLQAKSGAPSKTSQTGLKQSQVDKGFFLACKCHVDHDLEIQLPKTSDLYGRAVICDKEMITPSVWRLYLEPSTALYYHPGQFINIRQPNGVTRSYSLASIPNEDLFLELHVQQIPGGTMSRWLTEEAEVGDEVDFQGPLGDCYYRNADSHANLLLICTGTGLAPMLGIVRDALNHGHLGQIHLYHGSSRLEGIYNTDYLHNLQKLHSNFNYTPCVSRQPGTPLTTGRANAIAFDKHQELQGWRVFIAGNPQMTYNATHQAVQQGADPTNIFADPFEYSLDKAGDNTANAEKIPDGTSGQNLSNAVIMDDPPYPKPDPQMWQALDDGKLLTTILTDFYDQVFEDEKLNGFFKDTTKTRAIEKQYNFLRKVFTGEKVYFGEKPRNAHHWMVISEALFDYREGIMKTCLEKHGLHEHLIERWMAMEYSYKDVIVKNKPWNKIVDGVEYPVDGFGETVTEISTLCDGCGCEIDKGEHVSYHLRLGTVYCNHCKTGHKTVKA